MSTVLSPVNETLTVLLTGEIDHHTAAALRAGRDVRFALIGAGVYASHGYERSHRKGVENTLRLIEAAVTA